MNEPSEIVTTEIGEMVIICSHLKENGLAFKARREAGNWIITIL